MIHPQNLRRKAIIDKIVTTLNDARLADRNVSDEDLLNEIQYEYGCTDVTAKKFIKLAQYRLESLQEMTDNELRGEDISKVVKGFTTTPYDEK